MSLSLPPDLQRFVDGQIASGGYSDEEALMTAAVVALREKKLAELKAKVQQGIEQIERGDCLHLDDDHAIETFFNSFETYESGDARKS